MANTTRTRGEGDLIFEVAIILVAIAGLCYGVIKKVMWLRGLVKEPDGWLWFATEHKHKDVLRVGVTHENPDPLLPRNVRLVFKLHVDSQREALEDVAAHLGGARVKGAFYDRQSCMAYISHLKGEW